jgi:hypothetical protein
MDVLSLEVPIDLVRRVTRLPIRLANENKTCTMGITQSETCLGFAQGY